MDKIITTNSNQEFIKTICEIIKEDANKNIDKKGQFTFVLSGGRTPKAIFEELATNYKTAIEWNKVHFFWLDERCVEPTHKDSNYKLAYENLISKLDEVGSIHRIKGELEPTISAKEYKKEILDFFRNKMIKFDFILLGMGEDGHVASIFPNSRELEMRDQLVLATEKKYNGYFRVTLGLDVIYRASFRLLMINNKVKYNLFNMNNESFPVKKINRQNMRIIKCIK